MRAPYFAPDGSRLLLGRALAGDIELRLSVTWPVAKGFAEARGGGYARRVVPGGAWQIRREIDPLSGAETGRTVAEAPLQIFRFTGPLDNAPAIEAVVYVDRLSGQVLWADPLVPEVPIDGQGGDFDWTPRLTQRNEVAG